MNKNILLIGLIGLIGILINLSFYLKMGKVNWYLIISGLAIILGAVLFMLFNKRKNTEGFQSNEIPDYMTCLNPEFDSVDTNMFYSNIKLKINNELESPKLVNNLIISESDELYKEISDAETFNDLEEVLKKIKNEVNLQIKNYLEKLTFDENEKIIIITKISQFLLSIINILEEEIENSGMSNNPQESEGEGSVCDTAVCTPAEPDCRACDAEGVSCSASEQSAGYSCYRKPENSKITEIKEGLLDTLSKGECVQILNFVVNKDEYSRENFVFEPNENLPIYLSMIYSVNLDNSGCPLKKNDLETPSSSEENITIIALKPEESKKLSVVAGKTQVLSLLDTLEMKHLSDLNTVLRTVAENSSTMYSVQQDLGLIVEILEQFIMRNTQRETTPVSITPEYSALRDNLAYVFQGYAEKELAVLEKMRNIFSLMYNIVPIENKGSLINSYLFEVNKRLLTKQKEAEMKRREEMYKEQQEETPHQEPARDPVLAEERLNAFLQDKTPDKFEELFGKVEPQDMVYSVGVPVGDFMKQIIRPQDWSRALRPPSCIRDSTQLVEPVAILDQGIPPNVHEFRGGSKTLPKFAYTEVYDPKFY